MTSVVVAVAAAVLLTTIASLSGVERLPESVGHALSHLLIGAPAAWLLTAALRSWPPPRATAPGRVGRRTVVVGLAGVVTGQALEVAGARVDEPTAHAVEAVAHTMGLIVTNLSMLTLAAGGILALAAATRDGAVPRWVAAIVAAVVLAGLAMMIIGEPGT